MPRKLLLLQGTQLLEQLLQSLGETSGVHLQCPVVELLQLATQLEDGLLAVADQFLQVLIAQLLTCSALPCTLSAAFCGRLGEIFSPLGTIVELLDLDSPNFAFISIFSVDALRPGLRPRLPLSFLSCNK